MCLKFTIYIIICVFATVILQLVRMRQCGNKLELEAISGIAPGSMCQYLLRTKLSKYAIDGEKLARS